MSSGLYSHTTRGVGTVLTAAIYNADHVNHVTNQQPLMTGSYSDSIAQMQIATNPGGLGTELLAPHLAGEIERLRFAINRIQGTTHWYQAPTTSLAAIGGGVPLVLAFAATPLTLRRTENDTNEREYLSVQSGSGAGNKYSQRLVGTAANAVGEIREYIGTTEISRFSLTQITNNLASHFQLGLSVGAAGIKLIELATAGYMDIQEIATPANPSADRLRIFARDESGTSKLIVRDTSGAEVILGTVAALDSIRLGTVAQGSNFDLMGGATADFDAPAGNCMIGWHRHFNDPNYFQAIRYKPIQQRLVGGSYTTITG